MYLSEEIMTKFMLCDEYCASLCTAHTCNERKRWRLTTNETQEENTDASNLTTHVSGFVLLQIQLVHCRDLHLLHLVVERAVAVRRHVK